MRICPGIARQAWDVLGGIHELEQKPVTTCPSCSGHMQSRTFPRTSYGDVQVDLCTACWVIWFDKGESGQLSATAVIELFRDIHALPQGERRPTSSLAACPRCSKRLVLTHDVVRTSKLAYFRCPDDHGRLTPFYQFLREKQFIRDLHGPELSALRARVQQIQCSNCGAAVSLADSGACEYCGSPIAILDQDAVEKALRELDARARQQSAGVDPAGLADAMIFAERQRSAVRSNVRWSDAVASVESGGDLLGACIGLAAAAIGVLVSSRG